MFVVAVDSNNGAEGVFYGSLRFDGNNGNPYRLRVCPNY